MIITSCFGKTKRKIIETKKDLENSFDASTEEFIDEPSNNNIEFIPDDKSIIFKKEGKIIGSILKNRFFKYLTLEDNAPIESDDYIIEQYIVNRKPTFSLIEKSPLLTDINILIELNNILYEYEKSIANSKEYNFDKICDFMIIFLRFTLESVGIEMNKNKNETTQNIFFINYSAGIVFRLNKYISIKLHIADKKLNDMETIVKENSILSDKILSSIKIINDKTNDKPKIVIQQPSVVNDANVLVEKLDSEKPKPKIIIV